MEKSVSGPNIFNMKLLLLLLILTISFCYAFNNETLKVRLNVPFFKFFSKNGHHVVSFFFRCDLNLAPKFFNL